MRKILTALAFGAATLAATPAIAEPLANPAAQLEKLSIDNLSEILRELGAQQIEPSTSAAGKSVTFRDGNIPYHMILAGCDKAGGACIATIMLVVIDGGSSNYPLDSFNSFNKDNSFVSAIKLDGTKFAVTRMIVTSGGISRQNMAVNIANFAQSPNEIIKFLSAQLVAGYENGGATQFQRAGLGMTQMPHAVLATPAEIGQILQSVKAPKTVASFRN
jgi:hypothetical protein